MNNVEEDEDDEDDESFFESSLDLEDKDNAESIDDTNRTKGTERQK
jgi:hypothetical protein